MKTYISKSLLSMSTILLLSVTGCSDSNNNTNNDDGSGDDITPTTSVISGIGIDGILMQATVCIDEEKDGNCIGDVNTTTNELGEFTFAAGSPTGPLILSGGYDKSLTDGFDINGVAKYKPFTGELKAPEGSSVVTPLTSAIQSLMDNNSSVSAADAEATIKTAMGLDDVDVDLTQFDPYNGIDGNNSVAAQKILAKQTQLQILVHTAAATIAGADDGTDVADAMSNVFDSIVKSLDTGAEVELDAQTVAIATREAAAVTYENATNKDALVVAVGTVAQAEAEDAVIAANGAAAKISDGAASDAIAVLDSAISIVNTEDGNATAAAKETQPTDADDLAKIIAAREAEDAAARATAEEEAKAKAAREAADKALADAQTKDELEAAERLRAEAAAAEKLAAEKAAAEAAAAVAKVAVEAGTLLITAEAAAEATAAAEAAEAEAEAIIVTANIEVTKAEATADFYADADADVELESLIKDAEDAAAEAADEAADAKELINSYKTLANAAATRANENAIAFLLIEKEYTLDASLTTAVTTAASEANSIANDLSNSSDLNITLALERKESVLARELITRDGLTIAQNIKVAQNIEEEISSTNEDTFPTELSNLLNPTSVANVADAKNMFAQIRETAITFSNFDQPENNTSTVIGSQLDTIKNKIQPAAEAIAANLTDSVTALQDSVEQFQTDMEVDFNTTLTAIDTRIADLVSATEKYAEDANWSVIANDDNLSHTYVKNADATFTDVFTLNNETLSMTSEIDSDGSKQLLTTTGAISLRSANYDLSVSEITLGATSASIVASGTLNGENNAVMTLSSFNITTDLNKSIDNVNMFQNVVASLNGTIVVKDRKLEGVLNLDESSLSLGGNYTGLTTEPSFDGNITLNSSFNAILNDAADQETSHINSWSPLLMVTFEDGNKSLVNSFTEKCISCSENSYVSEYNLTTQSGKNVIVSINGTWNDAYDENGHYRPVSATNTVSVVDGATITPYYTTHDKLTIVTDDDQILLLDNAWYIQSYKDGVWVNTLQMDVRDDGEGFVDVNVSDVIITQNPNMLERKFDTTLSGAITHNNNKIVASVGIIEDFESKIYAQNIEITDGASVISLRELTATVTNSDFLALFEDSNDDSDFYSYSRFQNYTVVYDENYNNSEDGFDSQNILDIKLENLHVSLYDTENEILKFDANISAKNRENVSSSFDGSYEYIGAKFVGHLDANGTLNDLANGDTEVIGSANLSGTIEANGFRPFEIVTTAEFTANSGLDASTIFTRDDYKLAMHLMHLNSADDTVHTTEVSVGDSNGVLGNMTIVNDDSATTDEPASMTIVDKNGNTLATYGEDANGNEWEIVYSDDTSETLF